MLRGTTTPDVQRSLRALFEVGSAVGLADSALLDRYLDAEPDRSTSALEGLVERHAPMVRRVCSSVLDDHDAAADAFQATFLVLARRARSIRRSESVGPWLFGVARRVALRHRLDEARRRRHERQCAQARPMPGRDQPEPDREAAAQLFTELDRLHGRYRDPIVLCYLEGLSHEQAAARLGCRLTTLRTRLARGKDRLRDRLTRRGITPAAYAGLLTTPSGAGATVPADWIARAVAAGASARGPVVAATVVASAQAVSRILTMNAWLLPTTLLAGAIGVTAAYVALASRGADTPPAPASIAEARPPSEPLSSVAASIGQDQDQPERRPPSGKMNPFVCPTDNPTTIVSILPEGTVVARGQRVCQVSSEMAEAMRDSQRKSVVSLDPVLAQARARLASDMTALNDYERVVSAVEIRVSEFEVQKARADEDLAEANLAYVESQVEREGQQAPLMLDVLRAKAQVADAKLASERAKGHFTILTEVTAPRRVDQLREQIEAAKGSVEERERTKTAWSEELRKREEMIEACTFVAPIDGVVTYCSDEIQEGATVVPGQPILWCAPKPTPQPEPQP